MKLARPTFVSVAALFFALSLTAAQAGPQTDGMSQGGGGAPAAGAGDGGPSAGPAGNAPAARPDQPGSSAGQSGAMSGGPDGAPPKGSAAGSPSATDDAGKESKGMAEDETDRRGDRKDGRAAEQKSGSAAENQPDKRDGMSEDKKGATAEGKSDPRDKAGKSVRLESKDLSKVRAHFSQNKPSAKRIDRDDVSVSIGVALPSAIVLYDLPPDVIVVAGACPIQYFVWDDDVVLVDSCTREVVEIIADVA